MYEAIGQQQDQGRVQLKSVVEKPHFFGVAALEKLGGEVTIHDGKITATRVGARGQLESIDEGAGDKQATLLVGAHVPSWTEHIVSRNVMPSELDQYVADAAAKAGIKVSAPFVLTVEGDLGQLRLHVINGACPMHARLNKIEIPKDRQPFELELEKVHGTLVGIFAKEAVGSITHPSTSLHMHLLFKDASTGKMVTGHVERIGLMEGAVLRLPKV
jgi:alpha-acetolactate decarboxylase